jgi:hypothetical protein
MAGVVAVRAPQRKRQTSPWVFVPLATAFLIIAGIAIYGIISPYNLKKPPPPGQRGSLVWGDGIFSNRAQLKAWLGIHGASYAEWAKTHPRALYLVKPRPKRTPAQLAKARKAAALKAAAAAKKPKPTPTPAVREVASAPVATSQPQSTGVWIVVVLGLILGAAAAIPSRLLWRAGVPVGSRERELRIAAIGAGAALLIGVIAATIVG